MAMTDIIGPFTVRKAVKTDVIGICNLPKDNPILFVRQNRAPKRNAILVVMVAF